MAGTSVITNGEGLLISLDSTRAAIADTPALLRIAGELMRGSIARTFREEGSPAESWPKLAISTMLKKGYTSGHKLLILSGRLFKSFTYVVSGNVLTIGTDVVYAAVQNFGSADRRGGSVGAQARISGRDVIVGEHGFSRDREIHYTRREVTGKDGKKYLVPTSMRSGKHIIIDKIGRQRTVNAPYQGPLDKIRGRVGSHRRFQNIPARPFLVFRPEDPTRIMSGFEAFLASKLGQIGTVTA